MSIDSISETPIHVNQAVRRHILEDSIGHSRSVLKFKSFQWQETYLIGCSSLCNMTNIQYVRAHEQRPCFFEYTVREGPRTVAMFLRISALGVVNYAAIDEESTSLNLCDEPYLILCANRPTPRSIANTNANFPDRFPSLPQFDFHSVPCATNISIDIDVWVACHFFDFHLWLQNFHFLCCCFCPLILFFPFRII